MRSILLTLVLVCLLAGCQSGDGPSDMERAGPALQTALEAWKAGTPAGELESGSPSILMNESDWHSGKRLLEFKMEDKGSMYGRQVRWRAQLRVQDKGGYLQDYTATYVIDTTPRIVIVRDTFAS